VRCTLVLANAVKEPRNLRLLGEHGRLVPTKLSHEEIEDLQFKAKQANKRGGAGVSVSAYERKFKPSPTHQFYASQAEQERTGLSARLGQSNTYARVSGNLQFVDPSATKGTEVGLFMADVVDCRPGMFSPVFADYIAAVKQSMKYFGAPKDSLTKLELKTVTLIGSERCFSLEFTDQRERDHFVVGMGALVERCKIGDESLTHALTSKAHDVRVASNANGYGDPTGDGSGAGRFSSSFKFNGKFSLLPTSASAASPAGAGGSEGRGSSGQSGGRDSSGSVKKRVFGASLLAKGPSFASLRRSSSAHNKEEAAAVEEEGAAGESESLMLREADDGGAGGEAELVALWPMSVFSPAGVASKKSDAALESTAGNNGTRHEAML